MSDLDAAQENYLQAALLEDQPVVPYLSLADIAARKGKANEADDLLAQAEQVAQTPLHKGHMRQMAA